MRAPRGDDGAGQLPPGRERCDARQRGRARDRLGREDQCIAGQALRWFRNREVLDREEGLYPYLRDKREDEHRGYCRQDAPHAPALDGDRPMRGREGAELAQKVPPVRFHERAKLGWARDSTGRSERFSYLLGAEVFERFVVDTLGVGSNGKNEHHVRQVDGLAPGRRPHLRERGIDEEQLAIAHHEVPGLDVAMGNAGVPELPEHIEALIDDLVVDDRFSDLDGALEELHHHHVFALRRDLDDAVRRRNRDPRVPQKAQHVVLYQLGLCYRRLEQNQDAAGAWTECVRRDQGESAAAAALGLADVLLAEVNPGGAVDAFERAVQDRAPHLVPAVCAHVTARVQLREHVRLRVAFDLKPQRG